MTSATVRNTAPRKQVKLSRTHAPTDLSPVEWQRGLRRQFGREQSFLLENLGADPFFSEFKVTNPVSKSSYRVAVRGLGPGGNFCSCPDYATNELGTCKHLEFTLANWRGSVAPKQRSRAAISRRFPSSICATRANAACIFAPVPVAHPG